MSRKKRRANPSMNNPVLIGSVGRQLVTRNGAAPYLHTTNDASLQTEFILLHVFTKNSFKILLLNWIYVILMYVCSVKRGGWNFKIALSPHLGAAFFLQAGMNGKELV